MKLVRAAGDGIDRQDCLARKDGTGQVTWRLTRPQLFAAKHPPVGSHTIEDSSVRLLTPQVAALSVSPRRDGNALHFQEEDSP